jgi:tetraacyldisaccharide 4'-kinase
VILSDPFTLLYRFAVGFRNLLYDRGILRSVSVPAKVISVGNLSVGGSGKTSLVRFLGRELGRDQRVAVVMRGYRRSTRGPLVVSRGEGPLVSVEEAGDEAYLLSKVLPGVTVVVSEDRVKGAELALSLGARLLILDDGFQHRRIARDVDIVCLTKRDVTSGTLPFGRLREPLRSLRRADAIVLSYQEIEPFEFSSYDKPVFRMVRRFGKIINSNFEEVPLNELKGKELIAFSGLGNNEQFFKILEKIGFRVVRKISFRDHHHYRDFSPDPKSWYITTPKDLVKLPPLPNLYALDFDLEVPGLLEFVTYKISC